MWISHVVSVDGCFYLDHIPSWSTVQCLFSCAAFSEARGIEYGLQEHTQLGFCLQGQCQSAGSQTGHRPVLFILCSLIFLIIISLKNPFAPLLSQVSFLPPFQQYLADTYYLLEALLFHGLI